MKKRKELEPTELLECLSSRNYFNQARKLVDIEADTNKVKSSSDDEKLFNDLNGLINDKQNKKLQEKVPLKK